MSRLLNMRIEAREELVTRMEAIHEKAADEDGRDLSEDEERELEELRSSVDEMDQRIKALEGDAKRSAERPEPRSIPKRDTGVGSKGDVQVRSEPGPYGDGPAGLRRFLTDTAVVGINYQSTNPDFSRRAAEERQEQWRAFVAKGENEDINSRAVAMSNLAGIVNPQFDPSMISRGIYDVGVTTQLLNRYPIFSEGDSITMPRVTTQAAAAIHVENAAANDTSVATTAVKADLFTVAAKVKVSIQSIERGTMSTELLSDELRRCWIDNLNSHVLYGNNDASNSQEPNGLLNQIAANAGQFIEKDDGSATAIKQLGYLTDAKTAVWKANRRRVDAYIVGPDAMGDWENAQTNGVFIIPPYATWAQNVGGAGSLPEKEGITSEFDWRRVPVYTDPEIGHAFADGGANTGGDQSRYIAMCRADVPIFYDGPMTYSYEQTHADDLAVLLVVRGYAAFNPHWRPEAWRVIRGTGTLAV